jgi:Sortase domain
VSALRRPHVPLLLAGIAAVLLAGVLALRPARTVRDVGAVPSPPARPAPVALGVPPVRLELPGPVTAQVVPVGVNGDGALAVPEDPHVVGWWSGSAAPGASAGSTVLAGHVDTAAAGPGALATLARIDPGTLIRLATKHGRYDYRVAARRTYPKAALPMEAFDQSVATRLVLVTCGGPFHDGRYDDNLVVYARPTADA